MSFQLPPIGFVREIARTAARAAIAASSTDVGAQLDLLSDALNRTGIQNGRILTESQDGHTRVTFSFPEGYSPIQALAVIDAVRQFCSGLDAQGVISALNSAYAVKRQTVTVTSTVGMTL